MQSRCRRSRGLLQLLVRVGVEEILLLDDDLVVGQVCKAPKTVLAESEGELVEAEVARTLKIAGENLVDDVAECEGATQGVKRAIFIGEKTLFELAKM